MKFDIKDVKSWNTRNDVKIGDEGCFCNHISDLYDMRDTEYSKIEYIRDNQANCFSSTAFYGDFSFFLPLNAVKENKPKEKGYRPFRTIAEVDELLAKDSVKHYCFVGSGLYLRYKAKPNITKQITITNLEVDTKTNRLLFINSFTPKYLVKTFEIKLAGEWFPFGVEVKDE